MSQRRATAVLSATGALVLLTGCANDRDDSAMDGAQARGDMVALVQQTIDAVAGGNWTPLLNEPASSECSTAEGSAGVTFSWDQERTGTHIPESLIRTVATTWKQADYDVTIRQDTIDDGRPLWSAVTSGQAAESISVNASPRRVSIEVQSNCGVGTSQTTSDRNRARGEWATPLKRDRRPHRTPPRSSLSRPDRQRQLVGRAQQTSWCVLHAGQDSALQHRTAPAPR
jgi:hypothetical protein